jgi:uncharacterized protein YfaS (alpha-2-macroglobulin family)
MEQTSSATYPNVLVADYVRKARAASPEVLKKAEYYIGQGYQRLLTFEQPGGGFGWFCGTGPETWLSAYGLLEFTAMARVYPVDGGVIDRTRAWLLAHQAADGSWSSQDPHVGASKLAVTAYVAWALLRSGARGPEVTKAVGYIRKHADDEQSAYTRALAANALAAHDPKDAVLLRLLRDLDGRRREAADGKGCFVTSSGWSLAGSGEGTLAVETTALAVLAMIEADTLHETTNRSLEWLASRRDDGGTWGSTQATVLALEALAAAAGGPRQHGRATFTVLVNGRKAQAGEVNEGNADLVQQFDLTARLRPGRNEVVLKVDGDTAAAFHVVGRHYVPWKERLAARRVLDVAVECDRTKLSTGDLLRARAKLRYDGKEPTHMVMVELGVPPGFTADADALAALVAGGRVSKYGTGPGRVTLYVGEMRPGETLTLPYSLRPKYPVRAKTPPAVAYEYYTPAHRASTAPIELIVEDGR